MSVMPSFAIRLGLVLLSFIILSGCSEEGTEPTETTRKIEGKVLDAASGQPLAQVSITTFPATQSILTGVDGKFSITNVPSGEVVVFAQKAGYPSNGTIIQVDAPKTYSTEIRLSKEINVSVLNLDGSGDYMRVPNAATLNLSSASFTIEASVYISTFASGKWHWIVGHGTSNSNLDYLLGFEDGHPMFIIRSSGTTLKSPTLLQPKQWYHIAGVVDVEHSKVTIYVDGSAVAETALGGVGVTTNGDLYIGAREVLATGNADEYFSGMIYDLRLWNQARSTAEIQQLMGSTLTGIEPGLVGYWRINEGAGTTIIDMSNYGHPGSILGNPTWSVIANPLH